ncbi:MAG: hypothetical protein IZT59_03800 [Verrucomicrobia bacterium]|nr:hypothetical protein [Verrucomicrobiota bacterium]
MRTTVTLEDSSARERRATRAGHSTTIANATVFGTGLPEGDWMVNTSEI